MPLAGTQLLHWRGLPQCSVQPRYNLLGARLQQPIHEPFGYSLCAESQPSDSDFMAVKPADAVKDQPKEFKTAENERSWKQVRAKLCFSIRIGFNMVAAQLM